MASLDGAGIELRPTRYQFAHVTGEPGNWDANWLAIHGRVWTAAGESWTFDDACLTTWEARTLRDWLRAAAEGRLPPTALPAEDSEGLLAFTEPHVGFSVAAQENDVLVVRVHLSAEAAAGRPGADAKTGVDVHGYCLPIRVGREDLLAAVGAWEEELAPFPRR